MAIARHSAGPRMSGAVVHNNTVYLAGQVAADSSAGVKGQTEQVLKKIDAPPSRLGSPIPSSSSRSSPSPPSDLRRRPPACP